MAWIGVVTNAGNALLTRWNGDNVLKITSATAGTGTVAEAALMAQTALVSQKQTISIIKDSPTAYGRIITLRITSQGVTANYVCNQMGVWAQINDETPVLLAIYQDTEGQPIPAEAASPEFVWTFSAAIEMDNTGTLQITIDSSAYVTQQDLTDHNASTEAHAAAFAVMQTTIATKQDKTTIVEISNASPALGELANNTEYRCTNTALTAAPTITIPAISATGDEFVAVVIYKSPGTTAPVITNNSGYTLKYSGTDVDSNVFTPVSGTIYRLSFLFDGIYLNIYIMGVEA